MKDNITKESIEFLNRLFDKEKITPCHAYPISSLPYPKEKMKRALKEYIVDLSGKNPNASLEKILELRRIKCLYMLLADFIEDTNRAGDRNVMESVEREREMMNAEINASVPIFKSINILSFAC